MKLSNFIQRAWRYFTTPEMILYIVFGVLTTVINVVVCGVFYYNLHWNILAANAFAWVLSVAFAFITNKLYVFRSKSFAAEIFVRELVEFVAARLLSLGVDEAGMWLLVTVLIWNAWAAKILVNVAVVIINYVLSKLVIFKKK
ncbi:MAG: GtrA family protein [Oscillospiraceae bacterium]|nr:GtrA family protein [Oscillospiraceae bacterium]